MTWRPKILPLILLAHLACQGSKASSGNPPAIEITPATKAQAALLLEAARVHEPDLTKRLQGLATQQQARLHGLDHRLKSANSLARKIQSHILRGKLPSPEEVTIDDVLRYTLLIEDDPRGHYDQTARKTLRALEAAGHRVIQVKNYWPPGDSYAGLNCVLSFPDGFRWELQIHTIGSLAAKKEGHDLYEVMRLRSTDLGEKRRIFDKLTIRWNWVRIPQGILLPGSVHESEVLRKHKRP